MRQLANSPVADDPVAKQVDPPARLSARAGGPDRGAANRTDRRLIMSGILDCMGETSDGARFSLEQRERLRQAILGELIRAWDAAVAAGVPAEALVDIVNERRRAIESGLAEDPAASPAVDDDVQDGGDDPVDNGRIGH